MNQMKQGFFPKVLHGRLLIESLGKKGCLVRFIRFGKEGGGTTMTNLERARGYVAKMPPAISGQGGHDATFAVAKAVIHDFALSEAEGWRILLEYNERCSPPWSEQELRHKMESARNLTRAKRDRGALANRTPYRAAYCPIPRRKLMRETEAEPRILGQVSIEMFEGPQPPAKTPAGQLPSAEPKTELPTLKELTEQAPSEPLGGLSPANPEDIEANRIVGELRKLNDAGALKKPEDPPFFAGVIRLFGATFLPKGAQPPPPMADTAPSRWSAKILTGYHQPRTREEHADFLAAAFEPGDTFDFADPDDVAEFDRLYRRAS